MSAPCLSDGIHSATSSLESATEGFLYKQRKKRLRKANDDVLPVDEERSLGKRERMANKAAQHGSHILKNLTLKRQALSLAVKALGTCTDSCLSAMEAHFSSSSSSSGNDANVIQSILEHYFINYLRLRDGLVLLTSGECRHPGDSKRARSKKASFKSSFGSDASARGDGYTALFSAEGGYSGTGWDEFYDEHLGVRTRLVDACLACAGAAPPRGGGWSGNRVKVWDKLLESGAENFESALDLHDTETKAITNRLEQNRQKFMNGFNSILGRTLRDKGAGARAGKITMVTTDKFERIELQNASSLGISHLVLERRGDNFRIHDDEGVLPSDWNLGRWKQAMKLADEISRISSSAQNQGGKRASASTGASNKSKKRRIIEDSDSSDDECDRSGGTSRVKIKADNKSSVQATTNAKTPPPPSGISGGLKVKVKSVDASSPTTGNIAEIKSSFGVDVEALSRGRENLEAEQKLSAATAVAEEAATAAGVRPGAHMFATASARNEEDAVRMEELKEGINELREDVKSCEKILKHVDPAKADDQWDARESLREVRMMLGNDLLELNAIVVGGSKQTLDYAKSLFLDSIELISEQFKCIDSVTSDEDEKMREMMRRGLVLLRGRAETNTGIALLEEAKYQRQMQQSRAIGDGIRGKGNATKTLLEATKHLQKAVDDACLLKDQIVSSPPSSRSEAEQKLLFEAQSLNILALCRYGDVLWHLGRKKDAVSKFESAASINDDEAEVRAAMSSATGHEFCLDILCERYFAIIALIEHASSAAEKVPISGVSSSNDGKDQAIDLVYRGYDIASSISDKICRLTEDDNSHLSFQDFCEERDILSRSSLTEAKIDVKKWWEGRKRAASLPNVGDSQPDRAALHREFLSRSRMPSRPPTATITIAGSARRTRANDKRSQNKSQNSNGASSRRLPPKQTPNITTTSPSSVTYRKWGDDLLPNRGKDGLFPYPACAPELPPDMQGYVGDNF